MERTAEPADKRGVYVPHRLVGIMARKQRENERHCLHPKGGGGPEAAAQKPPASLRMEGPGRILILYSCQNIPECR